MAEIQLFIDSDGYEIRTTKYFNLKYAFPKRLVLNISKSLKISFQKATIFTRIRQMSRPISSFFNKIQRKSKLADIDLNAVQTDSDLKIAVDQPKQITISSNDATDVPATQIVNPTVTEQSINSGSLQKSLQNDSTALLYRDLCQVFEKIEQTTKRLEIQQLLTQYFIHVITNSKQELVTAVYLCLNKLGPEYQGKELGVGEGILVKAIANSTGKSASDIKKELAIKGDLGLITQSAKATQKLFGKPKSITITDLFSKLKKISEIQGNGGQQKKIDEIQKLVVAGVASEPKYLIRTLEGKLRIGLAQQTVLISLAHASVLVSNKKASTEELAQAVSNLKQVYSIVPNFDTVLPILLEFGHKQLEEKCQLTPGIPLKPMLAHPTKSLSEVLDRFTGHSFTCEYKYDGERVQIHKFGSKVMIYSRNSEDLSNKYPDIIARITKLFENIESFIIDCEAVAFNTKDATILPFQILSTRKRKNVNEEDIAVQVCVFAFDLLYIEGESIVQKPLRYRRELLKAKFQETQGEFQFAKSSDSNTVEDIQIFLDQSIAGINFLRFRFL